MTRASRVRIAISAGAALVLGALFVPAPHVAAPRAEATIEQIRAAVLAEWKGATTRWGRPIDQYCYAAIGYDEFGCAEFRELWQRKKEELAAGPAARQGELRRADLEALFPDNTADGSYPNLRGKVVWRFLADGVLRVSGESSKGWGANHGWMTTGSWRIEGDRLCLEHEMTLSSSNTAPLKECYAVVRDGDKFTTLGAGGEVAANFTLAETGRAVASAAERARNAERTASLAREREQTERLRKELEAARAERRQLVAEQKAAAEEARRERELLAAERKAAEAESRKLAEARAKEAPKAEAGTSTEDAQLAALVKKLQESNLLTQGGDTELPLIRATLPKRVEVGDRVRIAGLVGDRGSPPRLKVNGQPAALFRLRAGETPIAKHTLSFAIDIDAEEAGSRDYVLEACDAAGNCVSERLSLTVLVANRPNVAARNFALVIGNDDYRELPGLRTAVADAKAVAQVLSERYAFAPGNVKLLLNADRATILRSLSGLRRALQPDDRLMIYYAGHGQIDPVTEEGFWQPVDALPDEDFTWIANSDIRRSLRGIPAKHVLVVADSCFSGSLTRGTQQYASVPKDRFYTAIDEPVSRKVISSGGTEPVADSGSAGHSVFAYYLLKALHENKRPYLASFELFSKLAQAVTNNSAQKPQFGTVSEAGDEGAGDFTFILKTGG